MKLADDRLRQQREQFFFIMHMPIERRRLHAQALGQTTHREAFEANFIEQGKRRLHHLLTVERPPPRRGSWRRKDAGKAALTFWSHRAPPTNQEKSLCKRSFPTP